MNSIQVPNGFLLSGVHCGIKSTPVEDLTLIQCEQPTVAAGVYTENRMYAASVEVNRSRTPSDRLRTLVVNSGNANACTGRKGVEDCLEMGRLAAEACGANDEESLILSTGIIGELLPMEKISAGIQAAAGQLANSEEAFLAAARGITTTDKSAKTAGRAISLGQHPVQLTGFCKGAGMIGPRMATMLAVVLTDAKLTPAAAQESLAEAVNDSFNCISVEGHMSTNDTVLLLASGSSGDAPLQEQGLAEFTSHLKEVCIELARQIADDGEGASHLINLDVQGCATRQDAFQIAQTIANSALVKTGVAGADPNWGRIISAIGYAGVNFDRDRFELTMNGTPLFRNGEPVAFDAAALSKSIRDQRDTLISLQFADGTSGVKFWTSDLTVDYVRFNSEYHT